MIKEVYGIYEGSVYEGGGVDYTVYKGKGVALRIIEDRVKELQKEDDEVYGHGGVYGEDDLIIGLPYQWKEKEKGYWTNGLEVIKLIEFKVK